MGICRPVPALQIPTKSSMLLSVLAGFRCFQLFSDISDVDVWNSDVDVDADVDVGVLATTRS